MRRWVAVREVEGFLRELGNTPDEIAATLRDLGIKGRRVTANSCPIANYLSECYERNRSVSASTFNISINRRFSFFCSSSPLVVPTPSAIAGFIRAFDQYDYPFLVMP